MTVMYFPRAIPVKIIHKPRRTQGESKHIFVVPFSFGPFIQKEPIDHILARGYTK